MTIEVGNPPTRVMMGTISPGTRYQVLRIGRVEPETVNKLHAWSSTDPAGAIGAALVPSINGCGHITTKTGGRRCIRSMDDKLYRSPLGLSQLPRKSEDADNAVDRSMATHQGFRLGHRRDVTRGDVVEPRNPATTSRAMGAII